MLFRQHYINLSKLCDSINMADNYLEKKMEALQNRKAKERHARQVAWKKRMDAYRKRLQEQAAIEAAAAGSDDATRQEDSGGQV